MKECPCERYRASYGARVRDMNLIYYCARRISIEKEGEK